MTMAPSCDSDSPVPELQRPDPPTQLSLLSQSVMDQQVSQDIHTFFHNVFRLSIHLSVLLACVDQVLKV